MPAAEKIVVTDRWRVAHAFNSALPGWLVALPLRHVVALDELTEDEAQEIGPLLHSLSSALRAVTGCVKTYVILLAETEGFAHVHFHVVPRMTGFTDDQRGPNVFSLLGVDEPKRVPSEEMNRIALAVRAEIEKTR
jgi:diadenosine tetraphosphate (Ap4A) HIT family hydrolase